MRGALITIRCQCGLVKRVPYGDTWSCETCGRRWNTNQIPAEEYWGIMREMRRFRLVSAAAALVIALVFVVLTFAVSHSFLLLLPLILGGWYIWYMPWLRRKVRQRARNVPNWELRPD